ncbi:nucleoside triphosphate pyrophosphohydrolase family protein [Staphylococcus canis]|uniref:Nucleoside triphosphate pyrophosphohydrolase family protein n=1 Tax=Staphylococcus canis TaxID=2724942 RepID=A0ABS0T8W4_9STAP|nr:nucleoside triphosphate pyrophosphohydrolase family protein [Staphylococcus canis]MBI5974887.1 nucleoside triphosphate pyrophosphohydrolase family protein [Staphylococcus canis]
MEFNHYQKAAQRTLNTQKMQKELLQMGALGLNGEAGEVADIIKKHFYHEHPLDVEALKKELGDVLWYIATCATTLNVSLDEIAQMNIEKLEKRYPNGFNPEDSKNRKDE